MKKALSKPTPALVFFDLGEVVVDVDKRPALLKWTQLTKLSAKDFDRLFFDSGVKDRMDRGEIDEEAALRELVALCQSALTTDQLRDCWNSILGLRAAVTQTIRQVAERARVAVISNTDPIHANYIEKHAGIEDVVERWIYSFDVASMKPEYHIFRQALSAVKLRSHQTLLVDDRPENLEAAARLGFDVVHFVGVTELRHSLLERGLLAAP